MGEQGTEKVFEIGLVMAGAISGGAYAAGVVDFLAQALEEWEAAKAATPDDPCIPRHQVRLRVLSGASAGGMTAALLALSLHDGFDHATDLVSGIAPVATNRLYGCWVEMIDLKKLLTGRDLDKDRPLLSFLDSTELDIIASYGFSAMSRRGNAAWPFVDEGLEIILTLANLRGVPYAVRFQGNTAGGHEMVRHQEAMRFVMGRTPPPPGQAGAVFLNLANRNGPNWSVFREAALATGAYPLGLAPRLLDRPMTVYNQQAWDVPRATSFPTPTTKRVDYELRTIPPDWRGAAGGPNPHLPFLAVDGGLMNNEPFELARKALAGGDGRNPRGLEAVKRSLIMVDPFPEADWDVTGEKTATPGADVLKQAALMFSALKSQARFKPDELALAMDEEVFSRFLIAPSEGAQGGDWPAMAAACLGGFGGFLSQPFRRFDYQLGRRNCQRFLKEHFALPLGDDTGLNAVRQNPVFNTYPCLENSPFQNEKKQPILPIIPLYGSAAPEIPLIPRPSIRMSRADLDALRDPMLSRLTLVADALGRRFSSRLARWAIAAFVWLKKKDVVAGILDEIQKDLEAKKLFF